MSQATQGLDIQNVTGANYRQYVNEALKQVATMSSGATAPSNPQQQQLWFDTNNNRIKIYSGTTWSPFLLTATGNTALGFNALENTNSPLGLTYNTAIGVVALQSNTSGDYNTALGHSALYFNTTGNNNTVIGFNAACTGWGINITTQNDHVVLGNSSVQALICSASITGHSDGRDKKDVESLNFSGLAYINALIPRKFVWNMRKCVGSKKDITEIGFIAQEVESVQNSVYAVPGIVSTYDVDYTDPETNEHVVTDQKLITQSTLIPILVKAIQELTVRVELLETALQAQ